MAPKLPFMPFYGSDFYDDEKVRLMQLDEEAVYLRLLWVQWREGSLPAEPEELEKLARTKGISERVLICFPVAGPNGRRKNPRLERIRVEQAETRERLSEAGKRGRAKQLMPQGGPGQAQAGHAQPLLGESESDTDTESHATLPRPSQKSFAPHGANGKPKGKHSRQRSPPVGPGDWVNQAVEIYAKHIGYVRHTVVGDHLKPVVAARGWDEVKRVLECFCEMSPYEEYLNRAESNTLRPGEEKVKKVGYNTEITTFVKRYTHWAEFAGVTT